MRNSRKVLTIISIVIIILVVAIVGIAYAVIFTDTFKNNKQRFFKYVAQNSNVLEFIKSDELKQYNEKKKVNPFENNGEFSIKIKEDVAKNYISNPNIYNELQKLKIVFNGKVDLLNKYEEKNVSVQYSNGEKMTLDYLRQDDFYGLKIENVLKKYIVVQNDNLKDFAKKLQISDTSNIPNKIKIREIQNYMLDEKEMQNLMLKIYQILDVNLTEDKFSKTKESDGMKYTLNLNTEDIENIINTMYETIINDENINKKMQLYFTKEIGMEENEAKNEILRIKKELSENKKNKSLEKIDDNSETIESDKTTNNQDIKINIYEKNGKLVKTDVTIENQRITFKNNLNKLNFKFEELKEDGESKFFDEFAEVIIEKQQTQDELQYRIESVNRNEKNKIEVCAKYKGIQDLKNIEENYSFSYKSNEDNTDLDVEYVIANKTVFKDNIEKKKIKEQGVKINGYNTEKLQTTIGKIIDSVVAINKRQMETLNLKESENPVFYIIPLPIAFNSVYENFTNQENKILNNSEIAQLSKKRELTKEKITEIISKLTASYYEERIQNTTIAAQSLDEYIKGILNTDKKIDGINNIIRVYGYKAKFDESKGIVCISEDDSVVLVCQITNGRTKWSEEQKE